ncbi:probable PMI40 - mannose-6-phosphate isomerase [Melanopsichium pennsylvanicum]|uniref:Mannose-6-phosphate isomerase n=2 Tax=Melanopsichium pennsylvanicum TaxID=63383 RepID=A0AAJ5C8F6_9BASI|nr:probable PMI40-mannose-6-phosphate isomerase [Melanopsichium pennsylvanicum 4]SNX87931.1 probable PMI40 - mannose-6-phosphate isomerase [Melanopsichium pennsylvanicum]
MASSRIDTVIQHINPHNHTKEEESIIKTMVQRVFQLIPGVQSYDWGIKGGASCSRVAQFASATKQLNFQEEHDKPYAELWMGTHPSCPSRIIISNTKDGEFECLSSYLAQHPELMGSKVVSKFSDQKAGDLPFLFKVLSVGKALSIQAHPDKELGRKLHQQRPDVYRDPNHKPEMAIALTPFRGFCGFRPLDEIIGFIKNVPEFAQLVHLSPTEIEKASMVQKQGNQDEIKAILKTIFANLMNSTSTCYEPLAIELEQRFSKSADFGVCGERGVVGEVERKLVLKLSQEFPRDVGIFCTFVLNISTLNPGEALFLQANEPHAYLEGEILECMASSDNVVRAGLTPKLRDTDTLISMCTYESGFNRGRMQPVQWNKSFPSHIEALLYDPPIEEFSVVVTQLGTTPNDNKVKNAKLNGPSVLLILQGEVMVKGEYDGDKKEDGQELRLEKGQLAFIAADTMVEIKNVDKHQQVRLARAFVEA